MNITDLIKLYEIKKKKYRKYTYRKISSLLREQRNNTKKISKEKMLNNLGVLLKAKI